MKEAIDPDSVIDDYFEYVQQYRIASSQLSETADVFWPRIQIRGLLIELAMKTYLCACGEIVEGHDLEVLATKAESLCLVLTEEDWRDRIEKINKIYFKHIDWNAKYLSRYPTPDRNLAAWITPSHEILDEMIGRIVDQSRKKGE